MSLLEIPCDKDSVRRRIWELMDRSGVSRFPKPVFGRIPNFEGAERAALKLAGLPEFQKAKVVKVNPDSPQIPIRRLALSENKLLVMPTPKLRKGFLILDPWKIRKSAILEASTIRGSFKHGKTVDLEGLPNVDLLVVGSVAITLNGKRLGKGGGYSEIEYGVLRELGLIGDATPVATTIHESQIVNDLPLENHDLMVDVIVTSTKVIKAKRKRRQPKGIMWNEVTSAMLRDIPLIEELRKKRLRRE